MPLAALFRNERIESWGMTSVEWAELKASYRASGLVMSCGQAGIPKTSSLGTQFFAHAPGSDCQAHEGGPESPEHLATKAAVARAAREIGWEAVIEFPAADRSWIADVLVTNGERTIAIEAQRPSAHLKCRPRCPNNLSPRADRRATSPLRPRDYGAVPSGDNLFGNQKPDFFHISATPHLTSRGWYSVPDNLTYPYYRHVGRLEHSLSASGRRQSRREIYV